MEKEQRRKQGLCLGRLQFLSHVGIEGSIPGKRRYKNNDPEMAHGTWYMHGALKDQWVWSEQSECREWEEGNQIRQASKVTDSHLDLQDLTTHRMNE